MDPPGSVQSISAFISRQHGKHSDRELSEIHNVDRAVVVEVQVGQEPGLTCVQSVAGREDAEVGDIHAAVAGHVAEHAEQTLGISKGVIVSLSAVAVAVEQESAGENLRGD